MNLVIFDCDGTIVDSQAGIVLSMEHAFKTLRMTPPTRAQTLSVVGLSLPEAFSVLAPEAEAETRRDLADKYKRAFRELDLDPADHDGLYPGAKEVIEALASRENYRLGIATGKSRRGVDRMLATNSWQSHFATIQTADDHPSKPHPSMILKAMSETGAPAITTVMIGDTTYDIQMARAAGAGAIGVTWGYHSPDELQDAGADVIVDTYADLPGAISKLLMRGSAAA